MRMSSSRKSRAKRRRPEKRFLLIVVQNSRFRRRSSRRRTMAPANLLLYKTEFCSPSEWIGNMTIPLPDSENETAPLPEAAWFGIKCVIVQE